jgi:S-adenosylmethionine-diacylglycerol 3-amino-3-carboxypropyl transferase
MSGFFSTLNYSSVNEDWRTEARALAVGPDDRVLCVTGSGARPLALLAEAPAHVTAVDCNPAQSALLALEVAAIRRLDFDELAAFLGLASADPRWRRDRLRGLRSDLGPHTAAVDELAPLVARGILYAGRWERHHARLARVGRLLRGRVIDALFAHHDLPAQRRFVRLVWDTPAWRRVFQLSCAPLVARLTFGDPAFYRHVAVPMGRTLYRRLRGALERTLARDNFMVSLALRGVLSETDLPPHLTREGHAVLRGRLDRLSIVTDDLGAVLRRERHAFTRLSLSDVPSFLDGHGFAALCRIVADAAAPGARFCIRQFATRYTLPPELTERLVREPALERRLACEDHAFAYEFLVGTVAV